MTLNQMGEVAVARIDMWTKRFMYMDLYMVVPFALLPELGFLIQNLSS